MEFAIPLVVIGAIHVDVPAEAESKDRACNQRIAAQAKCLHLRANSQRRRGKRYVLIVV